MKTKTGPELMAIYLQGEDHCDAERAGDEIYCRLKALKVPTVMDIDAMILPYCEIKNGLEMKDVHTCETTHCRAGWYCFTNGQELEKQVGWWMAGVLLFRASYPDKPIPDFFNYNNDAVLADIRANASEAVL